VTGELRWRPYGRDAVLFELETTEAIHALHNAAIRLEAVRESVPGASTLLISAPDLSVDELIRALMNPGDDSIAPRRPTTHVVDVTYDGADLADVATLTGLGAKEVIERHTAPTYVVAFLGFSRGFPYLAGLDPALVVPRLATPRTSVPAGSVAMGAAYTGIYPASTPGGWRLLGRTSEQFFDEHADPPSRLMPGDLVTFRAV
jgi:KipI family sensor histidine kinase inhibitor